jgi:hypothetical protein
MLETKCSSYLLTNAFLNPNVEALIIKEHGFPMNAHFLWKYIKGKFLDNTRLKRS